MIFTYIILFIVLWIGSFWIFLAFFNSVSSKVQIPTQYPTVTICIPAFNEEDHIKKTVLSVAALEYPQDKLQILVLDDGSTDKTADVVAALKVPNLKYVYQKNAGKASALNRALALATGEFFSVVDADSRVEKNCLRNIIGEFEHSSPKVASIISAIKIDNLTNILTKVQKLEYTVAILIRQLMSDIDTLHVNHGVLCVSKTAILRKVGGFDVKNITEDFELAMRLRSKGYIVLASRHSFVYTVVPSTFKTFWRQRVRWFRGYIQSHRKFKHLIGNRKFGRFGWFQMTLNVISPVVILTAFAILLSNVFKNTYYFFFRLFFVDGYLLSLFSTFPTLQQFLFSLHLQIVFPVILTLGVGILILYLAAVFLSDSFKNIFAILVYLGVMPMIVMAQWVWAVYLEVTGRKLQW